MSSQLEGLDPGKPVFQPDLETLEAFADRNGVTAETVRGWHQKGLIPTVKIGKRRMVNSVMLRQWLMDQEWNA